jgi:hypothetical protein
MYMHYDGQNRLTQQLEQLMTTIFTCRSVVKYNLSLDGEQKEEVLHDIDASLEVLRSFILTNTTAQPQSAILQSSQSDDAPLVHGSDETDSSAINVHETLQELYRMYHAYLDMNKQANLQSFVSRFNEVISVLNEVQRLFEQDYQSCYVYSSSVQMNNGTFSTTVENLLYKVKIFISDLYYVFIEFIRTLSSILQHNEVQPDTEKLSLSQERRSEKMHTVRLQRMQESVESMQKIQEMYQKLRRRRLQVEPQVGETVAFLEFLKETLHAKDVKIYQLGEILVQIDAISRLLSELIYIVADYEKIMAILLSVHE